MHELRRVRLGLVHAMNQSLGLWAAVLLLVGGLVQMIPPLYASLTNLTGGVPWLQIIVGVLSVLVALVLFSGDRKSAQ